MKQPISFISRGLTALAVFLAATSLAQAEYLYVANLQSNTIEKYSSTGTDLGVFASTGLSSPAGLAFDSRGNLYVANSGNNTITEYNSSGAELGVFASTGLRNPEGLAIDSHGNLYAANNGNSTIEKFSSTGTDLGVFASQNLSGPAGLAFDSSGNLYAANNFNSKIEKYSPTGTDLGMFAIGVEPQGITFDSSGNLYSVSSNGNEVDKISPTGSRLRSFGSVSPVDVAVDNSGNIFISTWNAGSGAIHEYDSAFNPVRVFSTGHNVPLFIAFGTGGPVSAVPEPSVFGLLGIGAVLAGGYAWRKKQPKA